MWMQSVSGHILYVNVDMVFTTLNMDKKKQRTWLSQEIGKKIMDKHVKGKDEL